MFALNVWGAFRLKNKMTEKNVLMSADQQNRTLNTVFPVDKEQISYLKA